MSSVFKPAAILMSGRGVGFVALFAIPIVLARVFTKAEFGTYKQLFLLYGTLLVVAQVGMAESLYYFLPGSGKKEGEFSLNAFISLLVVGLACFGLLFVLRFPIARWFGNPGLATMVPALGAVLGLGLASVILEILMVARGRYGAASRTYAAADWLRALCYVVPAAIFASVWGLLWGAIAFGFIRLAATIVYMVRSFPCKWRLDFSTFRVQLTYALPFALSVLIQVAQSNVHFYAVGHYFNAAAYAVYAVGCLQIPLVDLVLTSTSNVTMVQMQERLRAGDTGEILKIWRDATTKLALFLVPFVVALIALAHNFILVLFTAKYKDSIPLFMVAVLSLLTMITMSDAVLRVYAKMRFLIFSNLVKLLFITGVISWFLLHYGLMGGIISGLLASVLYRLITLARIKVLWHCRLRDLLPWRALLVTMILAAGAAVPALAVQFVLRGHPLPALLSGAAAYGLVAAGLLFRWGPITGEEKAALLGYVRRRLTAARTALWGGQRWGRADAVGRGERGP